jgi:superoxide dismutase, Cu-Zn family
MKSGVSFAVAVLTATIAPLAACANPQGGQGAATSSSAPPGTERMNTQLKAADGTQVATATIDFANGYATVTVEATANQLLSPGFHGLMVHSAGKCEANSAAPNGGSTGDFASAGSVFQAQGHSGRPASGDLTALQVRSDGSAKLVTTTSAFTAADLRNSAGTALILHQDADYLGSTDTGDGGKRIACGVIASAAASSTATTTSVTTSTSTTVVPPPSVSTSTVTVTTGPSTTYPPTTTVVTTTPPSLPPNS